MAKSVTIDDKEYEVDALTDGAKTQLENIKITDQEIGRLQQQLGIARAARQAFVSALQAELPKDT